MILLLRLPLLWLLLPIYCSATSGCPYTEQGEVCVFGQNLRRGVQELWIPSRGSDNVVDGNTANKAAGQACTLHSFWLLALYHGLLINYPNCSLAVPDSLSLYLSSFTVLGDRKSVAEHPHFHPDPRGRRQVSDVSLGEPFYCGEQHRGQVAVDSPL